jgi:hypothetical protein
VKRTHDRNNEQSLFLTWNGLERVLFFSFCTTPPPPPCFFLFSFFFSLFSFSFPFFLLSSFYLITIKYEKGNQLVVKNGIVYVSDEESPNYPVAEASLHDSGAIYKDD